MGSNCPRPSCSAKFIISDSYVKIPNNMAERLRSNIQKELPFSVGDVVLVQRDVGRMKGQEEGGIVYDIEPSGRVFINYGGVVSLLHDKEQVRPAPEDIREALELRLRQNSEDLSLELSKYTDPLRDILEDYYKNDTLLKYTVNSIKSFFRRYRIKRD